MFALLECLSCHTATKVRKTYYKTLAFLIQNCFKICKVHQGFKFWESKFLKPYVDCNTKLPNGDEILTTPIHSQTF